MSLMLRKNLFDIDRFFNDSWLQVPESKAETFFAPRVDIRDEEENFCSRVVHDALFYYAGPITADYRDAIA